MKMRYLICTSFIMASFSVMSDVQGIVNNADPHKSPALKPSAEQYKNAEGVLPSVDSVPPSADENNVPLGKSTNKGGGAGQGASHKYNGKVDKLYGSSDKTED